MKYNFQGIQPTTEKYNNCEAHRELQAMMNRGEKIALKFGIDRYGYEVAYPESKSTAWFGYQLNPESFAWIMGYLTKKQAIAEVNPEELKKSEYASANEFKTAILKMFVENKIGKIQFTPQIRETISNRLSAIASFTHGTISFRVERTEELEDYLREKGLIR